MTTHDLLAFDATAQAALVHRREVSPLEIVDAAIERAEQLEPSLNAIAHRLFDEARVAACSPSLPDGPFRGVPFLLKDIGARQRGVPQTRGNRALRLAGIVSPDDTPLGSRFRSAGLITMGVSNISEFGLLATTQPLAFGETRNPWDLTRSVGGSSGGAAALVAAGVVPLAHATDGGGSIRTPAAWCGLVGFKPSRGRMPWPAEDARSTSVEFAIVRSIRDAAALLDAVGGPLWGAVHRAPPPAEPFVQAIWREPRRLRVGLVREVPGATLDPVCVQAVDSAARMLESLGHIVEAVHPEAMFDQPPQLLDDARLVTALRRLVRGLAPTLGRPVAADDVEPFVWELADLDGPPVPAELVLDELEFQHRRSARILAWWSSGHDLLLTPTEPQGPPRNDALATLTPAMLRARSDWYCVFTWPFNYTGQPAISIPLHWTPAGLPAGVQLVAGPEQDALLLAVARQLEEASPWAVIRPAFDASIRTGVDLQPVARSGRAASGQGRHDPTASEVTG
jgi:amidase